MDVRCEKCQTEYELDESRLKPGGVTVKCTNCGHMFKIRKRTPTNLGVPTVPGDRGRAGSKPPPGAQPGAPRADSVLSEGSGPTAERAWLVRLENGEQKTCRELATLQQWIVAGIVTRESLISRSGKTWKRLGDITELGQYFTIADEARQKRSVKPTNKPVAGTMLGVGAKPAAAGSATGPSDPDENRATGNFRARQPTPPPPPPARRPPTEPPPQAVRQTGPSPSVPPPAVSPPSNRSTAAWAAGDIKQTESMVGFPQGPQGGRLSAAPDEPAFAGRVRVEPSNDSFGGRVPAEDDDDDSLMPSQRGSRVGLWIAVFAMLVIGAAAGVVYVVVFQKKSTHAAASAPAPADAAPQVATVTRDAAPVVTPLDTAAPVPQIDPNVAALGAGVESELAKAAAALAGKDDPASLAMRARLATALAQAQQERAGLIDKTEGDKLRKQAKQTVIDAAPLAQKAQKALPDDGTANLAMADVLRLQGKSARDVQRYIDQAKAKADARETALAEGMLAMRDGKLDDAQQRLTAADTDPGDVRAKLELALVALAQNRAAEAKALVAQVIATQPEHATAKALAAKLETLVANTDPLPVEDGGGHGSAKHGGDGSTGTPASGGGNDYDSLLQRANKLAETNCGKAMDLFSKALDQKPNGVEALTGMGYCNLDAKKFASAFSNFRAALAVSSKYEPALSGVAEAYTQMGRKDQAIEAWKNYLDVYPGNAKAKKQLELLGAGASENNGGQGSATTPTPPTPPPDPTPPPTPPAPAPSGSAAP
jgi:predicted Zn finger-like uncharacterized protein